MTQRLLNSLQTTVKLLLCFLLLALWSEQASAWDYEAVKRIESATVLPQQPDREVLVTHYGASPKASAAKNQKAINRAIAEMSKSGGGRVVIPAGTWRTGALHLLSHVNLVVSKGATLSFVFDTKLYPLVKTSWEGLECWNYSPCIYAREATDIAITGEGTVDGGGSNATWWAMCGKERFGYKAGVTKESQSLGSRDRLQKMAEDGVDPDKRRFGRGQGLRPQLINVMQCERVLIKGVHLINSPFWVIHPLLSKSITVDDVKIWNEGPNGDAAIPKPARTSSSRTARSTPVTTASPSRADATTTADSGKDRPETSSSVIARWRTDTGPWSLDQRSLEAARTSTPRTA